LGSGAAAGAGSMEFVGSPAGSHVSTAPAFVCGHHYLRLLLRCRSMSAVCTSSKACRMQCCCAWAALLEAI
jgi:hypothetical protein